MSFWPFKRDTNLQDALIRSYENQIGFLRAQLEYEQGKNDDLLNLIHKQAGLIKDEVKLADPSDFQPIQTGKKSWAETQRGLENAYATTPDKVKEHLAYIAANESVIAGDYVPPSDSERTN